MSSPYQLGKPTLQMREVATLEGRIKILEDFVRKGVRNPLVRAVSLEVVSQCPARNDWCEIGQLYYFIKQNVRYTQDIFGIDTYQHPARTLQWKGGDCLPEGTLLLTDEFRFVPIEFIRPGARIWGKDRWATVEAVWPKGALSVFAVRFNNGSWARMTGDHKVFVVRCPRHESQNLRAAANEFMPSGKSVVPCHCPVEEREEIRIYARDLRLSDVVVTPARIAFGREEQDPDWALLDGLYLSDGWADDHGKGRGATSFCISGKDGFPKEVNKDFVEALCARFQIPTRRERRYVAVNHRELSTRMASMGHYAWEKRALTIDLGEGAAAALLRGIMADSGENSAGGRTFTTTSRDLALQVRVLHKMFGISCGASYIEHHGGLGSHPIWRLVPRMSAVERRDGKRAKLLRVDAIEPDVAVSPCYDLTTDDHYVYLPEADVTVSNCDDHSAALCAMLSSVGFQTGFRVISVNGKVWEHIYALVGLPKGAEHPQWYTLDTTVPSAYPSWQPKKIAAAKDFKPIKLI